MTDAMVGGIELAESQLELEGTLLRPGDEAYDEARTLFNSMIDKRPALIAQCAGPEDVIAALRFGREQGLEIAVRAGGHSVAGASLCDGGLVIDVRPMKDVEIDPDARTARVGAGCTWADVDRATQEHGLATTGGRVSTTGVAGLTLGGGSGWLERQHGLSCDNLVSVELVTADGDVDHGEQRRARGTVLGAAWRRRQLRRRDRLDLPAAPRRPRHPRRPAPLRCRAGRGPPAPHARRHGRRARRLRSGRRVPHGAGRRRAAR